MTESLCDSCARFDVDCPIEPVDDVTECVEYRPYCVNGGR
jgi:hypothetical protein